MKPRLLDLFCGAGGASMGYHRAGFEYIVGVDNKPQPHYPFPFIQWDAVDLIGQLAATGKAYTGDNSENNPLNSTVVWRIDDFDVYHASPPCQAYSRLTEKRYRDNHPALLEEIRRLFWLMRKPYVIENVPGASKLLINPIMLCGSMFGLEVWRHRYFEVKPEINWLTIKCNHSNIPVLVSGSPRRNGSRKEPTTQQRREGMGIDWMSRTDLDQAIPPAYTEYIGKYLMQALHKETGGLT